MAKAPERQPEQKMQSAPPCLRPAAAPTLDAISVDRVASLVQEMLENARP